MTELGLCQSFILKAKLEGLAQPGNFTKYSFLWDGSDFFQARILNSLGLALRDSPMKITSSQPWPDP